MSFDNFPHRNSPVESLMHESYAKPHLALPKLCSPVCPAVTCFSPAESFEVDYVQLPLPLQYHVPLQTDLAMPVFGGPALGLETSCTFERSPAMACNECINFGEMVETRSADFGLVLGDGLDVAAARVVLMLDRRYDLGLTGILDGPDELRNRAWELLAGAGIRPGH